MTTDNNTDPIQAFMHELDQLCERHGLWLETGGQDGLVRVTPQQLGCYFGRRIDDGEPILCSLPGMRATEDEPLSEAGRLFLLDSAETRK